MCQKINKIRKIITTKNTNLRQPKDKLITIYSQRKIVILKVVYVSLTTDYGFSRQV